MKPELGRSLRGAVEFTGKTARAVKQTAKVRVADSIHATADFVTNRLCVKNALLELKHLEPRSRDKGKNIEIIYGKLASRQQMLRNRETRDKLFYLVQMIPFIPGILGLTLFGPNSLPIRKKQ